MPARSRSEGAFPKDLELLQGRRQALRGVRDMSRARRGLPTGWRARSHGVRMSILAVRRLNFCAGHRVFGHENKCARLHGHNYTVYVHAEGIDRPIDGLGRVIDFSVLKERLGAFIDTRMDHNM